jgi:hypothetical protein
MPKALMAVLGLLLICWSAAPAQARFFVGFGFDPGFYRPYPVFYRPYLLPPPPPPVYVAPRPAVIVERPVLYRSVSYRYSRPVVRHYTRVYHRRVLAHRICR